MEGSGNNPVDTEEGTKDDNGRLLNMVVSPTRKMLSRGMGALCTLQTTGLEPRDLGANPSSVINHPSELRQATKQVINFLFYKMKILLFHTHTHVRIYACTYLFTPVFLK